MKTRFLIIVLIFFSVLVLSLFTGPTFISPFGLDSINREILLNIRAPRIIVAALMGMALGASGAVLQGMLRNPLADPYVLGISSGASLFAALGIMTGIAVLGPFTVPLLAFIGAFFTGTLVGVMGWKKGGIWPERLLLAGVGLSFLFSALLMLIMSVSSNEGLRRAMLWIFGDLSMAEWSYMQFGVILVAAGLIVVMTRAKALNALILGDELSHSLGFRPHRERFIMFVSVGLMTAASVSLGGMIGFIGLLVPHMARYMVGSDNRHLVPASAIAGAALLCFADFVGRSIMSPTELPAGTVTAIIGSPYFLYLLRRKNVLAL